ncbi:hypothetical protein ACFV7R_04445 [Streptomyces sp. NPDC059866]|uniref:hypothetical protein n=1 Tax=Streptomyces sp. NPDC059866 TaxID=3346978 RepID=UPI003656E7F4
MHTALRHATHPRRFRPASGPGPDRAVAHDFDRSTLLLTPVADFLLATGELVAPDLYDAALTALTELGRERPSTVPRTAVPPGGRP